ncbi:MAG: hypothetical protein K6357_04190 [Elusimicrobiota bacterium]
MKIGIFQYKIILNNKELNKSRILNLIETSDIRGIDWLIFSELTLSGFSGNFKKASLIDADKRFFSNLSKKYRINISYGGIEGRKNKFITLNRNGEVISQYSRSINSINKSIINRKVNKKSAVFELEGFKVLPLISSDLIFPNLFWKNRGVVDIYTIIAGWPYNKINQWITLLSARAIENSAYVIGVNSICETGDKNESKGYSAIFSPDGIMILDCQSREGISIAEINLINKN